MKVARLVLKIVAASLAVAGLACCIIAYWDKIVEFVESMSEKLGYKPPVAIESDDYADWDE